MKKAVFLDKDGTIVDNIPYNIDIGKISIRQQTIQGLRLLQTHGFQLIIVTNQSGIAKSRFTEQACVEHMHAVIDRFLHYGVYISSYYYCPHDSIKIRSVCDCRKPKPGMLLQAAEELSINMSDSWMIGDILNDVEAGKRAQMQTILLDVGNETLWEGGTLREPDFIAYNIAEAAHIILEKRS